MRKTSEDELFDSPIATYNTLIVCRGNTCRSVLLHSLFESKGKSNHRYFSIGVEVESPTINDNTRLVLGEFGVPLCKERPQSFEDLVHSGDFDRLIVLDSAISLEQLQGVEYRRLVRFDIEDPWGKDVLEYRKTLKQLERVASLFA